MRATSRLIAKHRTELRVAVEQAADEARAAAEQRALAERAGMVEASVQAGRCRRDFRDNSHGRAAAHGCALSRAATAPLLPPPLPPPVQVKECARRAAIQKREAVAAANRVAAQEKEAAVAAALAEATAREIEAARRLRPELSRGRERGASRLASSRAGLRCK